MKPYIRRFPPEDEQEPLQEVYGHSLGERNEMDKHNGTNDPGYPWKIPWRAASLPKFSTTSQMCQTMTLMALAMIPYADAAVANRQSGMFPPQMYELSGTLNFTQSGPPGSLNGNDKDHAMDPAVAVLCGIVGAAVLGFLKLFWASCVLASTA